MVTSTAKTGGGRNGPKAIIATFVAAIMIFSVLSLVALDSDSNNNDPEFGSDHGDMSLGAEFTTATIAAGMGYTLMLKSDGTVWAWGGNANGQLGDGTKTSRTVPVHVMSDVTAISACSLHSLALKSDGTVWAWGWNYHGQVGDGNSGAGADKSTPFKISSLTDVVAISAGSGHSLALKSDGTVWAWGANTNGQLGDGTNGAGADKSTPVQVLFMAGVTVTSISAGGTHSLALVGGEVWAWGHNEFGQLGDNSTIDRNRPVRVLGGASGDTYLTDVTISAGGGHSLALKSDGTVYAWGDNRFGQLGDGTTDDCLTPVKILPLTGVTAISAGNDHSLALRDNGTVYAWGNNEFGQLGNGDIGTDFKKSPVQAIGFSETGYLTDVTAIAAGYLGSYVLKSDGTVWALGILAPSPLMSLAVDDKDDGLPMMLIIAIAVIAIAGIGAAAWFFMRKK